MLLKGMTLQYMKVSEFLQFKIWKCFFVLVWS